MLATQVGVEQYADSQNVSDEEGDAKDYHVHDATSKWYIGTQEAAVGTAARTLSRVFVYLVDLILVDSGISSFNGVAALSFSATSACVSVTYCLMRVV